MEQVEQPTEVASTEQPKIKNPYRGLIIMTCGFYISLLIMMAIVLVAIFLRGN